MEEFVFIGICMAFLLWRIISALGQAGRPIPAEIPRENHFMFRVSWAGVCVTVAIVALVLFVAFGAAGIGIALERQGNCTGEYNVPNPPFGYTDDCSVMAREVIRDFLR